MSKPSVKPIDARKLVLDLQSIPKLKPSQVSLMIDPTIYRQFQGVCQSEGIVVSRIVERMMSDFLESYAEYMESVPSTEEPPQSLHDEDLSPLAKKLKKGA